MTERDQHVDAATIADLDADLLEPGRAREVTAHLDTCADCRGVRDDLAEISAQLAAAPVPPMPTDVAIRIDAALRRAVEERDDSAGETRDDRVVALAPRRRRWLAPLMAAASVVVGFAVVGQVINQSDSADFATGGADRGAEGATDTGPQAGNEAAVEGPEPLQLSTESFRRDVLAQVYDRQVPTAGSPERDYNGLGEPFDLSGIACSPQKAPGVVRTANSRRALVDGEPAVLFLSGPRSNRLAVAVICQDGRPLVVAQARLHLD